MEITTQYAQTDNSGGCTITGYKGEEMIIRDSRLYALDIISAPHLKVIKIELLMASKPPHLVLDNIPNLERIELPVGQHGAVIHLNRSSRPQTPRDLVIRGLISEIDGAWPGVKFRQQASRARGSWSQVRFASLTKNLTPADDGELVILSDGCLPDQDHLTLDGQGDWLLINVGGVSHLQLNTPGSVSVDHLQALRTVFSTEHSVDLTINKTPRLRRVAGCGQVLSLRQANGSARQLTIDGRWKHASIADDRLECLRYQDGRSLTVYQCSRLKSVNLAPGMDVECHGALPTALAQSARFFYDEATLNRNIETLRGGDNSVLPVTLRVLGGAHEPRQVVHCLQLLAELCSLGISAHSIWECRRELSARHRNARSRRKNRTQRPMNAAAMAKADFTWHWHLPADLAPQGWEADLIIWAYCQASVLPAADYGNVMAHTCRESLALDTLIRLAGAADNQQALKSLAIKTIEQYVSKNAEYMLERNRQLRNEPTKRVIRLLNKLQTNTSQGRMIILFLFNILNLNQLLKAVPEILSIAPGFVRTELMAMSRKPDAWLIDRIPTLEIHRAKSTITHYRRKLMQAALASATTAKDDASDRPGTTLPLFMEAH
ncbi:hypothetical protein [Marinobacter sp.]|uniref:hypothetical protein n=1 Tax=Marinobacter sp. TaxID=50741 RepID=UPI003A94920D